MQPHRTGELIWIKIGRADLEEEDNEYDGICYESDQKPATCRFDVSVTCNAPGAQGVTLESETGLVIATTGFRELFR